MKVALQNGEIREIKSSTTGKTLYQWEEEVVSKGVEMDHATTIGTSSTGTGSGVFEGLWAALDFSSLQPQGASLTAMGSGLPTAASFGLWWNFPATGTFWKPVTSNDRGWIADGWMHGLDF